MNQFDKIPSEQVYKIIGGAKSFKMCRIKSDESVVILLSRRNSSCACFCYFTFHTVQSSTDLDFECWYQLHQIEVETASSEIPTFLFHQTSSTI